MQRAIDQIKIQTAKQYKPAPAPPTRKQITGWTVEQVGPKMWVVFRNSKTQGSRPLWTSLILHGRNRSLPVATPSTRTPRA